MEVKVIGGRLLDPASARQLMDRYDIPTPGEAVVADAAGAAEAAVALGFPVVLKAVAPGLSHKSDAGGVRVGLADSDAVAREARAMAAAIPELEGYLVQQMVGTGVELIIGIKRDPVFGPMVMAGLGGVWVELLRDVVLRPAPVSLDAARTMLLELRGAPLLQGFRGTPPVDLNALAEVIVSVGRLAAAEPEVAELDLNPVIAGPAGAVSVDVRVVRAPAAAKPVRAAAPQPGQGLPQLLNPQSLAVLGASASRGKQGGRLFHYLLKHGYRGRLYAVNPKETEIMGRPCFPAVHDLPEVVDLACIMVPAEAVLGVVDECGRKGIPAAIIYTAGFSEVGEQGAALQAQITERARRYGMRICGPNTVGVVNAPEQICAAFGMAFEIDHLPAGDISMVTQSGALGGSLLSRAMAQGIGCRYWICPGNEADITLSECLLHLADDPGTSVIAVFMESVKDPDTFREACLRARTNRKPIVVYKTGASAVGRRAVQSHTGSLAGDNAVYDAIFREYGVIRVHDLQALMDAAVALAWQPLPAGRRIAVVSASGGACSVIADESERYGLEIPLLREEVRAQIARIIPPYGASQNPVDVTMQVTVNPQSFGAVLDTLLQEESIDALVMMLTTNADPPALEVARGIVQAARTGGKPVLVARTGAEFLAPDSLAYYQECRIPVYPMPDRAIKACKALVDFAETVRKG